MKRLLPFFFLASLHAATFDFVITGGTSANNSQNGGNGNVSANDATVAAITPTIDGIQLTLTAVSTSGTATIGANVQGFGVSTNGESSSNNTRIEGDKGESLQISFDTDVTLDSLRFGNLNAGETVTIALVSGPNPFTTGTSLSISRDTNPDEDVILATDPGVTGGIGLITAGTVLAISTASHDFLVNELTVTDPSAPVGNLVTSIPGAWPNPTIAENPNPGTNLGLTTVALGNSKGQSFSVGADTSLTGFVFEVNSVTTAENFTLEIFESMDGLPWLLSPIFSDAGALPAGLAAGNLLQIDLPAPLAVERGSCTVALTGTGATAFSLVLANDPLYPAGAVSGENSSTNGWQRLANADADTIFAALGSQSPPAPAAPPVAPNIIFILADDYGWTDPQCGATGPNVLDGTNYGSAYFQTPNLARLAAEGLSFTHCFAHPNCAPTRAAILSGQYSARSGNGVYHVDRLNREAGSEQPTFYKPPGQNEDIPAAHTIVAEALQAGGYVTAHFGKYHVGNHEGGQATMPENNGYDFNFGGKQNGSPGAYHASGQLFGSSIGPGLDAFAKNYDSTYITDILAPIANGNDLSLVSGDNKHVEDALGDAAIAFMNEVRNGEMADRPFYLQLHNYAVHTPISSTQARDDLLDKYVGITSSDPRHSSNPYAAIAEAIDQTVKRILDYLDDPNRDGSSADSIASETLVIFTSDNGGHIGPTDNDPLRFRKGSFYNGGLRVPLIARQPGVIPAGQQTDTLVHAVDFYPTLVEHAGLTMPGGIVFDGTSFAAHMDDPIANPRDRGPIFYHFPGYLDQRARPSEVVIKRVEGEDYKLIYTYDLNYTGNPSNGEDTSEGLDPLPDNWELFRYSIDLGETDDLCNTSYSNQLLYQEIADGMAADLGTWLTQTTAGWSPSQVTVRSTGAAVPFPPPVTPSVTVPIGQHFHIDFLAVDRSSNSVTIGWPSEIGFTYDIEGSGDPIDWVPVVTDIAPTGSHTTRAFNDPLVSAQDSRFYRVVLRP